MRYIIQNLRKCEVSNSREIAYAAELITESGDCISVEISESSPKNSIVYNPKNDAIYPINGVLSAPKLLSEYQDGDVIFLGECTP